MPSIKRCILSFLLLFSLVPFVYAEEEITYCDFLEGTNCTPILIDRNQPNWDELLESILENSIFSAIQPTIINISPATLPQGSTANLVITASKAQFAPDNIQQVRIGDLQINDKVVAVPNVNQLIVNVTVPDESTIENFTDVTVVTNTQAITGVELFAVSAAQATPQILSITPNTVARGMTQTVTVYMQGINFDGDTQVDFGAGMNAAVIDYSAHSLIVDLTVSADAQVGHRKITVNNNGEIFKDASKFGLLQVQASEVSGLAQITEITPAFGAQGQTLDLALVGKDVQWLAEQSALQIAGIEVLSTTVTSATTAQAQIKIADDTLLGIKDIYMFTNGQAATKLNGFAVVSPASLSLDTASAQQGQRKYIEIIGENTHFAASETRIQFDKTGIEVSSIEVISPTHLKVLLRVSPTADTTAQYYLTAITGQELVVFDNFSVLAKGEEPDWRRPTSIEFNFVEPIQLDTQFPVLIATLATEDPDSNDTHTYTLAEDKQGIFAINGNELSITKPVIAGEYPVKVRSTDSHYLWYEEEATVVLTQASAESTPISPPSDNSTPPPSIPMSPAPATVYLSYAGDNGLITIDATGSPTTTIYVHRTGTQAINNVQIELSGDAQQGIDYLFNSATTLAWQADDVTAKPLELQIIDDTATQTTTSIVLQLIAPEGVNLGNLNRVEINIRANDHDNNDAQDSNPQPEPDPQPSPVVPVCEALPIQFNRTALSLQAGDKAIIEWQGNAQQLPESNSFINVSFTSYKAYASQIHTIEITALQAGETHIELDNCQGQVHLPIKITEYVEPKSLAYYCELDAKTTDMCVNPQSYTALPANAFGLDAGDAQFVTHASFHINTEQSPIVPMLSLQDRLQIEGFIKIDDAHYQQPASLFILLEHVATQTHWSYAQGWHIWNQDPASLHTYGRLQQLPYLVSIKQDIPLLDALAIGLTGEYRWHIGYQLNTDGSLVFNNNWAMPNRFIVTNSACWQPTNECPAANTYFNLKINDKLQEYPNLRLPKSELDISVVLKPDPTHLGQEVDLFVVATYSSLEFSSAYKRLPNGVWLVWDGNPDTLLLEREHVKTSQILHNDMQLSVFQGELDLAPGIINVVVGYTLPDAEQTVIYNQLDALAIELH